MFLSLVKGSFNAHFGDVGLVIDRPIRRSAVKYSVFQNKECYYIYYDNSFSLVTAVTFMCLERGCVRSLHATKTNVERKGRVDFNKIAPYIADYLYHNLTGTREGRVARHFFLHRGLKWHDKQRSVMTE